MPVPASISLHFAIKILGPLGRGAADGTHPHGGGVGALRLVFNSDRVFRIRDRRDELRFEDAEHPRFGRAGMSSPRDQGGALGPRAGACLVLMAVQITASGEAVRRIALILFRNYAELHPYPQPYPQIMQSCEAFPGSACASAPADKRASSQDHDSGMCSVHHRAELQARLA